MLIILFGTPGVGKNYVGRILHEEFNFHFFDADEDLTPDMHDHINNGKLFTDEMREKFYTIVSNHICQLQENYPKIVVAQTLTKESNRLQILKNHADAHFILIEANPNLINERLHHRNDWVSIEFAEKIATAFEKPRLAHSRIKNNEGRSAVIEQFLHIPSILSTDSK